jgi:hypothetical protein
MVGDGTFFAVILRPERSVLQLANYIKVLWNHKSMASSDLLSSSSQAPLTTCIIPHRLFRHRRSQQQLFAAQQDPRQPPLPSKLLCGLGPFRPWGCLAPLLQSSCIGKHDNCHMIRRYGHSWINAAMLFLMGADSRQQGSMHLSANGLTSSVWAWAQLRRLQLPGPARRPLFASGSPLWDVT